VLEHFHVSEAFKLIQTEKNCNIFSEFSIEEYKIMRKRIVECVLATDMTLHNKELNYMRLKLETYGISQGVGISKIFENLDNVALFNTQQEFLNTLMHCADISNPTKPLSVYESWVCLVMDEFWNQGDKEKSQCLPISFLCDRTTTKIPASQIGFIEGIVYPMISLVVEFFPDLHFLVEFLDINKHHYKKLKEQEDEAKNIKNN
jgi:cAMP-specific phosphodiesterase 4